MLLWLAFALLTAAVLAVVLAPLARPAREVGAAEAGTLAVYRDQLDEIEAERARGLVDDSDAAAARLEVSRRLLASAGADDEMQEAPGKAPALRLGPVTMAVAVLTPLLTLVLYLANGSPGLPSYPFAGRVASPLEQAQVGDLVAKVEARLR
jgi:cytochrome c-type biogenesis protein CcmH